MKRKDFLKRLFCRHLEYYASGYSYIRCKNCEKRKYSPQRAKQIIRGGLEKRLTKMTRLGFEDGIIKKEKKIIESRLRMYSILN